MKDEALKLALKDLKWVDNWLCEKPMPECVAKLRKAITAIKEALAQPAQSEWNAALDEAAARIGELKGFGKATQDSFAVFIKGLKR